MLCSVATEVIIKNLHFHLLSPANNKLNRTMLFIAFHGRNCIDGDLNPIRRIFEHLQVRVSQGDFLNYDLESLRV